MADTTNKTEKPTPRRLQKARAEGRLPNTRHLLSGFQFLVFVVLLSWCASGWLNSLRRLTTYVIERSTTHVFSNGELIYLVREMLARSLAPLAAGGVAVVAAVLGAQLLATQFGFSLKSLAPNAARLNPTLRIQGILRENLNSTFQALVLLPVFFYVTWSICRDNLALIVALPLSGLTEALRQVTGILIGLLWKASVALVVFGLVAYGRERRRYTRGLMMSRQEIIEENKEIEGNMLARMRIRRLQRDLRRNGMMQKVPMATAVVVNPTHYAVALRYEMDSGRAPSVLAKGKNHIALAIRRIAEASRIPIVENPPLAQALYRSVEVDQEIPVEFYRAVAEILAYVYRTLMARR